MKGQRKMEVKTIQKSKVICLVKEFVYVCLGFL